MNKKKADIRSMKYAILSSILLYMLLVSSCRPPQMLRVYDMSARYDYSGFTDIRTVLFNASDTNAILWLEINSGEFTYESEDENKALKSEYTIHYDLFSSYSDNRILDSLTYYFVDSMNITGSLIPHQINIPAFKGKQYIVRLIIKDMLNGDVVVDFLQLDRSSEVSRRDFLLEDENREIMIHPFIDPDEVYCLQTRLDVDTMVVRYYNREFPVALPPFAAEDVLTFDYKADSVFSISKNDSVFLLDFSDKGFYHMQPDSGSRDGYTVFCFYKGYPQLLTSSQLLQPLRYICSGREFERLKNQGNYKMAVDSFWLENAGNPMRARNMIKKFYTRAEDANLFFTSYHEGWKTDRGLIYIVFGPPRIVYFGDDTEEWIYGEEGHSNSIRYKFVKLENPFTDNDYMLLRSPGFRQKWYEAVNLWRR